MTTTEIKYKKALIALPDYTADELVAANGSGDRGTLVSMIVALRLGGWTYESMAKPLRVSRERIRQLYNIPDAWERELLANAVIEQGFVVPERPIAEEKPTRVIVKPSESAVERLLELQPVARQVRANSKRYRAEAEEYVSLIHKEHERGVTIYQLAKALGVTHAAIRSRLARYGYITTTSGSKCYNRIREVNRV